MMVLLNTSLRRGVMIKKLTRFQSYLHFTLVRREMRMDLKHQRDVNIYIFRIVRLACVVWFRTNKNTRTEGDISLLV